MIHYQLQTLVSKKDKSVVIHAKSPTGVSPGCQYRPSVHAHVVTAKCADSLPLYRIETMMERAGAPIARSTLCTMFHRTAECLEPIYNLIVEKAKSSPYLHADETHFKVQNSPKCHKGWMWSIATSEMVAYLYNKSRAQSVAKNFVGDGNGYLIIDGYAGYNSVTEDEGQRTRVGCWGHARRKFFVAFLNETKTKHALDLIRKLYEIEYRAAELGILGTKKHKILRQTESKSIVDQIDEWIDKNKDCFAPSLAIGKAITYAINQRERLRRFLEDPKIPLDNNFAERQLRIVAIGRKNYLFAGHAEGAQNLAILQTIVSTCRLQGINPYEYIKDMLIKTQTTKQADIETLAPWNWKEPKINSS